MVGNEIILVKRGVNEEYNPGVWGLPAGSVDEGEDSVSAVIRETKEEVGISFSSNNIEFVTNCYVQFESTGTKLEFCLYKVISDSKPEVILDENEFDDFAWVSLENLDSFDHIEGNKEIFAYCLENRLL